MEEIMSFRDEQNWVDAIAQTMVAYLSSKGIQMLDEIPQHASTSRQWGGRVGKYRLMVCVYQEGASTTDCDLIADFVVADATRPAHQEQKVATISFWSTVDSRMSGHRSTRLVEWIDDTLLDPLPRTWFSGKEESLELGTNVFARVVECLKAA